MNGASQANTEKRRLALCLDGTWNTMESQTNVSRMFKAIADALSGCAEQQKFYEEGVGTKLGEKVRGGAFGVGLDRNILRGYCWLVNNYQSGMPVPDENDPDREPFSRGDEIFIFGFSRGAFTARSLAGLINRVGIIDRDKLPERSADPDRQLVQEAWELYRRKYPPGVEARKTPECVDFRKANCHAAKIKFVGVWDTVGALGIPATRAPIPLPAGDYRFHDTQLGRTIENAFHAVAIDEHREDYNVTLWSARHAIGTRRVEQRWFAGAHANVGGGYDDDLLPDIPLLWMAQNAAECGLEFTADMNQAIEQARPCLAGAPAAFGLSGSEYMSSVRDSYGEFLWGTYKVFRALTMRGPFYRRILVPADGVAQTIDPSAMMKWNADADYKPRNLVQAGRIDTEAAAPANVMAAAGAPGAEI